MARTSKMRSPCGDGHERGMLGTQWMVGAAWCALKMTAVLLFPPNTQETIYGGNMRLSPVVRATFTKYLDLHLDTGVSGTSALVLKLLNDFHTSCKTAVTLSILKVTL